MTETYHAYIVDPRRPVRTFSTLEQAEAYRDRMAELGAEVRLQRIPAPNTEEIEAELVRQRMESRP